MRYFRNSVLLVKSPSKIDSLALHATSSYDSTSSSSSTTACSSNDEDRLTLFIGLSDGSLLVYERFKQQQQQMKPANDLLISDDVSLRLRMTLKRFNPSKRGVTQLTVVDKWGLLLSVLDGELMAHSITGEPFLSPISGGPSEAMQAEYGSLSKNVLLYSVDPDSDLICVVCKRTLTILRWKAARQKKAGGSFVLVQQITTPETARAVQWAGSGQICIGYYKDYVFFDAHTGVDLKRPRMRTGARKSPVMCYVRGTSHSRSSPTSSFDCETNFVGGVTVDEQNFMLDRKGSHSSRKKEDGELLCCKDNQGFFVGFDGMPARSGGIVKRKSEFITWGDQPSGILACQPYIIGLLPKRIEIHLASSCEMCEILPISGTMLAVSNVDGACVENALFNSSNRKAMVFVASDRQVHLLVMTPLQTLVDDILIQEKPLESQFEHALQLCETAKQPIWGLHSTPYAMSNNLYSGAGITSEGLELLIACVHARYALFFFTTSPEPACFKTAMKQLEAARDLSRLPLEFVMRLFTRTELFGSEEAAITLSLNLTDLRSELGSIYHYHFQEGGNNSALPRSSPPSLAIDYETPSLVPLTYIQDNLRYVTGPELSKALLLLFLPYVLAYRKSLVGLIAPIDAKSPLAEMITIAEEILGTIDTLLLRAFVLCDALRDNNAPNSKTNMIASTEMRALSARMMEQKMKFLREKNWCHVEDCEKLLLLYPEMWEELLWLYYGKGLHEDALDWLYKLERNERTREQSDNGDVENNDALDEDVMLRMKSAKSSPYIEKTIEYLKSLGKPHADIVFKYSKWVILSCPVEDSLGIFVNIPSKVEPIDDKLIIKHLEELDQELIVRSVSQQLVPQESLSIAFVNNFIRKNAKCESWYHNKLILLYVEYIMHLRAATCGGSDPSTSASEGAWVMVKEEGMDANGAVQHPRVVVLRKNLLHFLQTSKSYSAQDLAHRFKVTDLYAEYAVLLSRLSRHEEALAIYINDLKSYELAEEYCERIYDPVSDPSSKNIFLVLLQTLVDNDMIEQALKLAEGHVETIDNKKVLDMLPPTLPLRLLEPFLAKTLRHHSSANRDAQIVKQLTRKEHISVRQAMFNLHRKYAVINRRTLCANPKCQRHIQSDQAIARLPSGQVVHYACLQ